MRAKKAGLAELSDVALLKRQKKSRDWLRAMCGVVPHEGVTGTEGFEFRADGRDDGAGTGEVGVVVEDPLQRAVAVAGLRFFQGDRNGGGGSPGIAGRRSRVSPRPRGPGLLAGAAIVPVASSRCRDVSVRVNTQALALRTRAPRGAVLRLLERRSTSSTAAHPPWIRRPDLGRRRWWQRMARRRRAGSVRCARAGWRFRRRRKRSATTPVGRGPHAPALSVAPGVRRGRIVFTTFPRQTSSPPRTCWSAIGCVGRWNSSFKRFKSLAQLGHLPKYDDSAAPEPGSTASCSWRCLSKS